MIKVDKGIVEIEGEKIQLLGELATAISTLHESIAKRNGEEIANALIKEVFRLSLMSEGEVKKENEESAKKVKKMVVVNLGGIEL